MKLIRVNMIELLMHFIRFNVWNISESKAYLNMFNHNYAVANFDLISSSDNELCLSNKNYFYHSILIKNFNPECFKSFFNKLIFFRVKIKIKLK